ncbi:MAG: single-stranded DNA-binding protein [Planctomycetaceae bacterium]
MASFNRVILMGNLTRDPQVRYTPNQTAVADLGLAINRTWFDKVSQQKKEDVTFVDVTVWGRTAEVAGEYLAKGRSVLIEGRLQLDQWDDKETGQKRSKLKVVCENMTMVGGRQGGAGAGGGGGGSSQAEPQQDASPADSFYSDAPAGPPNDEVPF